MKRTNHIWNKGVQWICAGLLTLLGFSTCDKTDIPAEYGTPHAKFTVSGKVTDDQGQALSSIRVVIPQIDNSVIYAKIPDTLYTKSDGGFEYTFSGFPGDIRIYLKFEDASLPPVFETDLAKVDFKYSELKGGDGRWYDGSAQKEVNVTLKPKQEE